MIDLEKLKLAHELIYKLSDKYKATMALHWHLHPDRRVEYEFQMGVDDWLFFKSLDDLITKLQRLQPKLEPKYAIGDEVWVRSDRDCITAIISDVRPMKGTFEYVLDFHCDIPADIPPQVEFECDLFPTRDGLIDAQIAYWSSLKTTEKSTGSEDVSMEPTCNSTYWDTPPPIPSKPQPKYSLNQCVWYAGKDGLLKKKITNVFDCDGEFEYELGDINRLDPMNKIRVGECRLFSLLTAEQGHCKHEYTLLSGFRCVKCDKNCLSTPNPNGDCMGVTNEAIAPAGEACGHAEIWTDKPYPRCDPPKKCEKCGEFYR